MAAPRLFGSKMPMRLGPHRRLFKMALRALIAAASVTSAPALRAEVNPLQIVPCQATLSVADSDREAKWYERVLGFHETTHVQRLPRFDRRTVDVPGYRIELLYLSGSSRPATAARFAYQGYSHVVFQTPTLETVYGHLLAEAVRIEPARDPTTGRLNHLTIWDAEDNEIEIFAAGSPSAGQDPANPLGLAPHHVAITVADMAAEMSWYSRVLGFVAAERFGSPSGLEGQFMDIPGYRLVLETKSGSTRLPEQPAFLQQGYAHITYQTRALNADLDKLRTLGVSAQAVRNPHSKALLRVSFKDPESNEIEIVAAGSR